MLLGPAKHTVCERKYRKDVREKKKGDRTRHCHPKSAPSVHTHHTTLNSVEPPLPRLSRHQPLLVLLSTMPRMKLDLVVVTLLTLVGSFALRHVLSPTVPSSASVPRLTLLAGFRGDMRWADGRTDARPHLDANVGANVDTARHVCSHHHRTGVPCSSDGGTNHARPDHARPDDERPDYSRPNPQIPDGTDIDTCPRFDTTISTTNSKTDCGPQQWAFRRRSRHPPGRFASVLSTSDGGLACCFLFTIRFRAILSCAKYGCV